MCKITHLYRFGLLAIALNWCSVQTRAQEIRSKAQYAPPLDIPLVLAGNFGEIRSNHFHSGLDFKTNGQSGYQVSSVEDGYISRVRVQPGGYGKSVYIKHRNGYTTVYGHLMRFRKDIEEFVRSHQYKNESFSVDLYLGPKTFPLKKGEFFALSGNSGSSQAPHLHFEVRDPQTDNPVNPLEFNFKVRDHTPPVLKDIKLYSLSGRKDLKPPIRVKLARIKGQYVPTVNKVYPVDDLTGIGINATDYLDDANNPCGIFRLEFLLDGELHTRIKIDEFAFSESKYINSFIDYKQYIESREHVLKSFIEPNNHLSIYEFVKNKGRLTFTDEEIHTLTIRVSDVHGNQSEASINLKLNPEAYSYDFSDAFYSAYFSYAETNRFEENGLKLYLGPNTLYDDLYFKYSNEWPENDYYSPIHYLHNHDVPLHRSMTLWIKPDNLPENLRHQAVIARLTDRGRLVSYGGQWEDGYLKTNSSVFGAFVISVDTIPPSISPQNFQTGEISPVGNEIRFRIRDDFSGIQSFRATVDNEWILFEYDPKTATLRHQTDPKVLPPNRVRDLKLVVVDGVGNQSIYEQKIVNK